MRAAGSPRRPLWAKLISLAIVAAAVLFALYVLHRSSVMPSTDDATIDADVVHVASVVGGRIVDIPVAENMHVAKGDLLFQIDPVPYSLTVAQTQADLSVAQAALDTQRRVLSTQRSTATISADQVQRAKANLGLAERTVERLGPLASKGYVPAQQFDQAQTARHDATTSLQQAREQQTAAVQAIDTEAGAEATVRARQAALDIARHALNDTTVRATHGGRVVGLSVLTGEIVAPAQTLFTLVNDDEWFVVANFRETDLHAIAVGDCVTAFSMIDRARPIKGTVQGIGAGVLDTDRISLPRSVPYIERSLNWVRVAQRFPVRIRLENPPQQLMRLGATAVVEVKHGYACR
ncbi:multidrug transporter subunit MdtN [Paraburkholderia sp. USG1]|uniref:multidrug transporter subunit MdtN n=1 Tax=Paraburkholderia sp. USG1 TaxID=2952268 RepID=UPI00285AAAC4|nr:multidrug transporter subunit MdtN [Paraburkholderia sp. USG1]MDR8395789.1 multidrug transporter subunit MdtN [Paraburkholderia sp. USG1]